MDAGKYFKDEDIKKTVEFINLITKEAQFNVDVRKASELIQGLQHMRQMVAKMEAHVLEIGKTFEAKPEPEEKKPARGRKKASS